MTKQDDPPSPDAAARIEALQAQVDRLSARLSLLDQVFSALPEPVFVKDDQHRFVLVNPFFADFVGRSVPELLGQTDRELFPSAQVDGFWTGDDAVISTGTSSETVEKRSDAAGRLHLVSTRKARVADGEQLLVVGTMRDLTDVVARAVRTEAELRSTVLVLDQITSVLPVGIAHVNRDGFFTYAFGPELRAMGISGDKMAGAYYTDLGALWPDTIPLLTDALAGDLRSAVLEWRGRSRHVTVAPTLDEQGQVGGATLVSVDLTAERDIERRQARSLRMDSLGRLAGGVAHDLNNLLSVVMMGSSVLRDALAAGDVSSALTQVRLIERSIERGSRLSRQLASFARRQVGPPSVVALHEHVRPVQVFLESLVGADVHLDFGLCAEDPRVRLAPGQVEQLLINLVLHAAAVSGGGDVRIETACVDLVGDPELPDGPYVSIRVSDPAPTLARADRDRFFEPFFDPDGRGAKMDLATCYGIAVQARGRVRALVRDSGNVSEVLLPQTADPVSSEADLPAVHRPARRGVKVLLAEDENVLREQLSQLLTTTGHTVVLAARDGQEALEWYSEHADDVDIVLSDIVMPRLSGVDLALALEGQVPIVLMSGFVADSLHKVADLGVRFPVLMKPVRPDEILQALQHELLMSEQQV